MNCQHGSSSSRSLRISYDAGIRATHMPEQIHFRDV
jgi:hypothetical protein